jgi:hypothetical protein
MMGRPKYRNENGSDQRKNGRRRELAVLLG